MTKKYLIILFSVFALTIHAQVSPPKRAFLEYLITPDHANREYALGETARLRVEAYEGGVPKDADTYLYYKVGKEMHLPTAYDSVAFHNGKAEVEIGTMTEPGFLAADVWFMSQEGKKVKDLVKVAFAPDDIQPYATMPKDFTKFWDGVLKQAAKIDMKPEITVLPEKSTETVEVSLVKLTIGKDGRCMYGYLARPKDGKKHPVLFNPPGAGVHRITSYTQYADEWGYISFTNEIHGNNPEASDSVFAIMREANKNYNTEGITSKESFYYKDVYAGCSRCIDFLCTLPDWDGENVHVTGGSQGGALTIVTAALNKKVTALAAFYPALCDLTGFTQGRAGGWPKYFSKSNQAKPLEYSEHLKSVMDYYDVVNFARTVTQPGFYSWGWNDDTCSPTSIHAMYGQIKAEKVRDITPTSGHWRFPTSNVASLKFMRSQVKSEK